MKLKLSFIIIWFLFVILAALPARAQDKYKVHLTNGRSIACAKYWYEGDKILLTTATDITFGFDKKEVVKIEGMEEIGARPAEPPKTLPPSPPAVPPTAPPTVAGKPLSPYVIPPASASEASPKPNMFPGLPPGMQSIPPGPWLPQGQSPAAAAPTQPFTPPAATAPQPPSAPPATAASPPAVKPPAAAVEEDKSPPEEPEIIMDEVQEEKEEPEPMEPPEEN